MAYLASPVADALVQSFNFIKWQGMKFRIQAIDQDRGLAFHDSGVAATFTPDGNVTVDRTNPANKQHFGHIQKIYLVRIGTADKYLLRVDWYMDSIADVGGESGSMRGGRRVRCASIASLQPDTAPIRAVPKWLLLQHVEEQIFFEVDPLEAGYQAALRADIASDQPHPGRSYNPIFFRVFSRPLSTMQASDHIAYESADG